MTHVYLTQEDIKPQFDKSLLKDVTRALEAILKALKRYKDKHGYKTDPEGCCKAWKWVKPSERDKVFSPLKDCLTAHTGLPIKRVSGSASKRIQAAHAIATLPIWTTNSQQIIGSLSDLGKHPIDYAEKIKPLLLLSQHHDSESGVFRKHVNHNVNFLITLDISIFDRILSKAATTSNLSGILLHEVGHIYDCIENITKKTTGSLMTEHVLNSLETDHATLEEAYETFHYYYKLIKSLKLKLTLGGDALSIMDKISYVSLKDIPKDKEHVYKDDYAALTSLMAIDINRYINKKDDLSLNSGRYKNMERKADRFAVRQGAGEGTSTSLLATYELLNLNYIDILFNGVFLKNNYIRQLFFGSLLTDRYVYDNARRRIERILQEYYKNAREVFDQDKSVKKDLIKTIESCRETLKKVDSLQGSLKTVDKVLGTVKSRWDRLFHTKKDRVRQNVHIENTLQDTIANPLYHEANKLLTL